MYIKGTRLTDDILPKKNCYHKLTNTIQATYKTDVPLLRVFIKETPKIKLFSDILIKFYYYKSKQRLENKLGQINCL